MTDPKLIAEKARKIADAYRNIGDERTATAVEVAYIAGHSEAVLTICEFIESKEGQRAGLQLPTAIMEKFC